MDTLDTTPLSAEEAALVNIIDLPSIQSEHVLPPRNREMEAMGDADYETYMSGLRIDQESYGIFGYMIINRNEIVMKNNDYLFITAEPRNIAPLEILTVYYSGDPYLTVFDWGKLGTGYHKLYNLNAWSVVDQFVRTAKTPSGDGVHCICFQNFYNKTIGANQVMFLDNNKVWHEVYRATPQPMPGPPSSKPSGWAVFEYKRSVGSMASWAKVPHMLGFLHIQLMDKNGKWFVPNASQAHVYDAPGLAPYYKRAYGNNTGAAYVNK